MRRGRMMIEMKKVAGIRLAGEEGCFVCVKKNGTGWGTEFWHVA